MSTGDLDALVAPALELAVVVARACEEAQPPLPVPKRLRALSRFAKLPPNARAVVRQALDDDEFRARVAAAGDEVGLARPSWLFLNRPDGWTAELDQELDRAALRDGASGNDREERSLGRRLAGAEAAVARLQGSAAAAKSELERTRTELASERRARREAQAAVSGLERRVGSLTTELADTRQALARRTAELDELSRRIKELEEPGTTHARLSAVERPLQEAVEAAAALERALSKATAAFGADTAGSVPSRDRRASPTPSRALRSASARAGRRRRVPESLPGGVLDDSAEAAEHLIRVPRMLVLVDGYNVTLGAWQDLPISTQRSRLLDACRELAARSGAEVAVVFDGAEEPGTLPPPGGRDRVRWQFTEAGVEADDVLLDLVGSVGADRPVTVASSDRKVRDGARLMGVNAISTPQLMAVLRRESG